VKLAASAGRGAGSAAPRAVEYPPDALAPGGTAKGQRQHPGGRMRAQSAAIHSPSIRHHVGEDEAAALDNLAELHGDRRREHRLSRYSTK
jgi:hypothetical protein